MSWSSIGGIGWGSIGGNWSNVLDNSWSSIGGNRGNVFNNSWSGISQWSGNGFDNWSYSLDEWFTVDNSVEAIDGIGSVLDSAFVAISIDQGVFATDNIAITFLVLVLGVAGQGVLDIISEFVLWMRIVFIGSLGQHGLSMVGNGSRSGLDDGSRSSICGICSRS